MDRPYLVCYFQIRNHTFAYRCEIPGSYCCGSHCCIQGLHPDKLWQSWSFWIFFILLLVFGFSIALLILTKFKPSTDLLSDDAFYMSGLGDRRMVMQNNIARRYRVSQGASALMQSLNNMASSGNNRRTNRSSYQHLLNFWTRQVPTNAWSRLPSTTMDRAGVIQPHLQYNNNKELPNMETTELNIMQGNRFVSQESLSTIRDEEFGSNNFESEEMSVEMDERRQPNARKQLQSSQGINKRQSTSNISNSGEHENTGFHVKPLVAPYRSQIFDNLKDTRVAVRPPVYTVDNEIRNSVRSTNVLSSNQAQNNIREENIPEISMTNISNNNVFNLPNVVQEDEA